MIHLREKAIQWLQSFSFDDPDIINRFRNSRNIEILSISDDISEAIGSQGDVYRCTLGTCSCIDWTHRKNKEIPCKHQFALAIEIIKQTGSDDDNQQFLSIVNKLHMESTSDRSFSAPNTKSMSIRFNLHDPRFIVLSRLSQELGFRGPGYLAFDIVDKWIKSRPEYAELIAQKAIEQQKIEQNDIKLTASVTRTDNAQSPTAGPFANMSFLFTGSLASMKREEAQARVEALGGKAASGVSKNLSVLVATSNTSTKWKKAEELNAKGANIQLWTEEKFIEMLNAHSKSNEHSESIEQDDN